MAAWRLDTGKAWAEEPTVTPKEALLLLRPLVMYPT
jgi:hypothetical protein